MSRRRRVDSGERFICLHHWMLRSQAWRALSPNAKAVLLHLWQRHNGSNNGQIVYAVRDPEEIGLSKDQAARALDELVDLGFLKIRRNSSFTLKTKEARVWEITAESLDGRPATKEFMSWDGTQKNILRSHQRDAQSHQRDSGMKKGAKNSSTVAPVRPSEAKSTGARSHQRDLPSTAPRRRVTTSWPRHGKPESNGSCSLSVWRRTRWAQSSFSVARFSRLFAKATAPAISHRYSARRNLLSFSSSAYSVCTRPRHGSDGRTG
jgi:hypothetical protein